MNNEWTVVKYGKKTAREYNMHQFRYVLPIQKKDHNEFKNEENYMKYLYNYLSLQLPRYGNFKSVDEATWNLYMNMHGGLMPKDMSAYEKLLLEYKYGTEWETKLGYT